MNKKSSRVFRKWGLDAVETGRVMAIDGMLAFCITDGWLLRFPLKSLPMRRRSTIVHPRRPRQRPSRLQSELAMHASASRH